MKKIKDRGDIFEGSNMYLIEVPKEQRHGKAVFE